MNALGLGRNVVLRQGELRAPRARRSVSLRSGCVGLRAGKANARRAEWKVYGEAAEGEAETATEEPLYVSEEEKKQIEADKLRAAEKFMVVGEGDATCTKCGYEYQASRGDPDFPVAKGTPFPNTPDDYTCPLCGAEKSQFKTSARTVAGFAVNQGYGFGTNTMTGEQKQLLIYGSLLAFFFLFLGGYFLE